MQKPLEQRGPFAVTGRRVAYENSWINVVEDQVLRPDGTEGLFGVLEVGRGRGGVSVLPIDDRGNVYLIEEYVYACGQYSVEVLSGGLEENEEPLDAAKRELHEELGLCKGRWSSLGTISHMTTIVRSKSHLFLIEDVDTAELATEPNIKLVTLPFDKAVAYALSDAWISSTTCCSILKAYARFGVNK